MRWLSQSGPFIVTVTTPGFEGLPVVAHDWPSGPAAALPRESDPPQLVAAERLGLFPYSDTADRDSVKGHAA